MNSFTLHAVGQLATDPELTLGKGKDDTLFALAPGTVKFGYRKGRKLVDVLPAE